MCLIYHIAGGLGFGIFNCKRTVFKNIKRARDVHQNAMIVCIGSSTVQGVAPFMNLISIANTISTHVENMKNYLGKRCESTLNLTTLVFPCIGTWNVVCFCMTIYTSR